MKDFLGDAKASAIIALIITFGAYIIGTIYYFFQGKGSVSWLFCLFFFLIVFVVLLISARSYDEEYKAKKQLKARRKAQIQERRESLIQARRTKAEEYDSQYGNCTKVITSPTDNGFDLIRVYESSLTIIIKDIPYKFNEIIGYSLNDNSRIIKGELSSSTYTSNASTIGRTVVGAALGGVAGAVIGGATAKQTTEYKQSEDKTIHDYSININVNRLSEPLVKLHIGKNEDLANEIAALINAIVVRNK